MKTEITKTCTRCSQVMELTKFNRRAASGDGYAAACQECTSLAKWASYHARPAERAATLARVKADKVARFQRDPAYKRAFSLWGSAKSRGACVPKWVKIMDFVPICAEAVEKGPEYEIDHIIPLNGKLVSGLHVPNNLQVVHKHVNQMKGNSFTI